MPTLRIEFVPQLIGDGSNVLRQPVAVATLAVTSVATPAGSQPVVPASTGQLVAILTADTPTYVVIGAGSLDPLAEPRMLVLPSLPRILPVSPGQSIAAVLATAQQLFTVTIPAGQSMSSAADLGQNRLRRIDMPAGWTAGGNLLTLVSADGVTYGPFALASVFGVSASVRYPVTGPEWQTVRFVRFQSVGTVEAALVQAAERVITLVAA